jgi:hypothetical protein
VTVTDVPSAIVRVEPVRTQPALGLQPTVTDTLAPEVRRGTVMVFAPTRSDGGAHPRVAAVGTLVARGRGRGAGAGALSDRPGAAAAVRRGVGRAVARGAADAAEGSSVALAVGVTVAVLDAAGGTAGADVGAAVGVGVGAVLVVGVASGSRRAGVAVVPGEGPAMVAAGVA